MSAPQSERATNRVGDLRESVLDRLEAHPELVTLLEQTEDVDDASDVIISGRRLVRLNTDDGKETPGVAIGVAVITGSSERANHHERKTMVVQATTQFRRETLDWNGSAWADDVKDEISAIVTAHKAPWIARGASGGTFEPFWNEEVNRFTSVQQFDVLSID